MIARARLLSFGMANAFSSRRLNWSPDPDGDPFRPGDDSVDSRMACLPSLSLREPRVPPAKLHPIANPATKIPTAHTRMETLIGVMSNPTTMNVRCKQWQFQNGLSATPQRAGGERLRETIVRTENRTRAAFPVTESALPSFRYRRPSRRRAPYGLSCPSTSSLRLDRTP
jgi:hypothetical protein